MEILSKFIGVLGIIVILFICYLMSNNKKKINLKTVGVGLILQFLLAVFIIKTPVGVKIFGFLKENTKSTIDTQDIFYIKNNLHAKLGIIYFILI